MPIDWSTQTPVITGTVQAREESSPLSVSGTVSDLSAHIDAGGWQQTDTQVVTIDIPVSRDGGSSYQIMTRATYTAARIWKALHDTIPNGYKSRPQGPTVSCASLAADHFKAGASTENGVAMTVRVATE